MTDFELYDGYRDQLSNESISYHYDIDVWRVRITPKVPGAIFELPDGISSNLSAVDFGTTGGFYREGSIPAQATAGEIVTLYFLPLHYYETMSYGYWGSFLSQVKVLHDTFPPYLGFFYSSDRNIVIDSPDFEAPEGIFNFLPTYWPPLFAGSTFKKAPRIYGNVALGAMLSWPPLRDTDLWEPFKGCPEMKTIANQGVLGENCEAIYASNLVYVDEEGYERVDAYPSGGKPRIISKAIGPLKRFELDSGSRFPAWDCSDLVLCHNPVVAEEVVLPTRSTTVSLPVGPDLRQATKLKSYINGIKNVTRGWEDAEREVLQECPLVFGLKLLGVDLPPSVTKTLRAHRLYRHQKDYGGVSVGIQATPSLVSSTFNYSLGSALASFYNNLNEDLTVPATGPELEYIDSYCSVQVDEEYSSNGFSKPFYFVKLNENGTLEGLKLPKLTSTKLKIVNGFYEWTYAHGRTGELSFTVPNGASYSGDVKYTLPALPAAAGMTVLRAYYYACAYTSGKGYSYLNETPAAATHLAFGQVEWGGPAYPTVVLNATESFFDGDSWEARQLKELISEENYNRLRTVAAGEEISSKEYSISLSRNGFNIESYNTGFLAYAFDWQTGLFYEAEVDPTTIENVLLPLSSGTKTSGAYQQALQVKTPLHATVEYYDQWNLNEPSQEQDGASLVPSFTLIASYGVDEEMAQEYTYKLEDISIPSFTFGDNNSTVYDSWKDVFSYLIYGDLDAFKQARGIPEDTDIGGRTEKPRVASGDYTGRGVLNWIEVKLTNRVTQVSIPAPLFSQEGQRGFGVNLFREAIPWYPGEPPLNGEPIFIDFKKVGANYAWSNGTIYTFRQVVQPETVPTNS